MTELKITDMRVHPGDSAFLLDDGETAILYDTGFAFTGSALAQKVREALAERPLDYIFLTHSHYDHAAGTPYVKRVWPQAKVVAGQYAARIFAKPTAKALMRELDGKVARAWGVESYEDLFDGLQVDIPVSDGDRLRAGGLEFTAVELPGHTKCSIGYYCPDRKLLLGCETLGVFDGEQTVLPCYLVGYEMSLRSIEKVEALQVEQILVPHLGLLDRAQTAVYLRQARKRAVAMAEEVVRLVKEGRTRAQILEHLKEQFYHGRIRESYPIDAMELNTGITVDMLTREFGLQENKA